MSSFGKTTGGAMLVVGVLLFSLIAGLVAVGVVISTFFGSKAILASCDTSQVVAGTASRDGLTVKGEPMTEEQWQNAIAITTQAKVDFPATLIVMAATVSLATSTQEATLFNIPYGYPGSTSLGLFQQIEDWGPRNVRLNPSKSAHLFFTGGMKGQAGLADIPNWQTMSVGDAAQSVQRSNPNQVDDPDQAFRDGSAAYQQHADEAAAIVESITGEVPPTSSDCDDHDDPISLFVKAAKSYQGNTASGDEPKTGAQLIADAAKEGGFCLPDHLDDLRVFEEDEDCGVTAEFVPLADILSGKVPLEPGMIPLSGEKGETDPRKATAAGVYVGAAGSAIVRLMTYNLDNGFGFEGRVAQLRQVMDANSIQIATLQEVEGTAMYNAVSSRAFLGDRYAIYPSPDDTGEVYRNSLAGRPIIYDRTDETGFEVVGTDVLKFRRMDDALQPAEFPVVKFLHKASGGEFYVINVHFPAYPQYAGQRLAASKASVEMVKKLLTTGVPVTFSGDTNEGTGVRVEGNVTLNQDKNNLLYCMFREENLMENSRDLSSGTTFDEPCPDRTIGPVDWQYLSNDLTVVPGSTRDIEGMLSDHKRALVTDVILPSIGDEADEDDPNLLGYVIGVNESGVIDILKLKANTLIGALKLTVQTPVVSNTGDWVFPLPEGTYTYSVDSYGPRDTFGGDDFHNGTDFGTNGATTPIVAMYAGEIVLSGYSGDWGNRYVVETGVPVPDKPGATYKYLYAHLSTYAPGIFVGRSVAAGEYMGNVGDTGNSFGEHLHLTICTDMSCTSGNQEGSIDPVPFLVQLGLLPAA